MASKTKTPKTKPAKNYQHPESESPMRPEVGTQAQFKKKLPPKTYRYDSSLSPALDWDGKNPAREQGEAQLANAEAELKELHQKLTAKPEVWKEVSGQVGKAQESVRKLKSMSKPFLNWAGKAERLSFDVPTLPLFIHERLSTKAVLETLKGHRFDRNQETMFDLWGDPQHSVTDQVLRAYEHKDKWVNRMILGDSLVVMNSLLRYEGLGGQVQMIYFDPPYGVSFGSNFQPFVRKRDVGHNDDDDMTREPEMVQAYRDTWELGLHSYLSYLRDRFVLARELLSSNGSIFVQISDENLHLVRAVMDEVFGRENFCCQILFLKTSGKGGLFPDSVGDYLLWYGRDRERVGESLNSVFTARSPQTLEEQYNMIDLADGTCRRLTASELRGEVPMPDGKRFMPSSIYSDSGGQTTSYEFDFEGRTFRPLAGYYWRTDLEGMERLVKEGRILVVGNYLRYKMYADDYPVVKVNAVWDDVRAGGFGEAKIYVVQTNTDVVARCLLMTTRPGDLVLDPTCGSGTTAYCAERWGRRWITMDTSRVPLALARQRLLTATYPWYQLNDESRGPASGFAYKRRLNKKGEEVGGIVPHIKLEDIANGEPSKEELLVDKPEENASITRVTGPFCVEATIPTPLDFAESKSDLPPTEQDSGSSFVERMLEVVRKSPVLRLEGNKTVTLKNVRPPARTLSLSAEAMVPNGKEKPVAFVFGPENGAVSEKLVYEAAREAHAKSYSHLYIIGFAIQPNARMLIEKSAEVVGIPATYVQATPDLMMGDLLKNMRSSQIFSVCGLPEIEVRKAKSKNGAPKQYEVELLGLDVFDPVEMVNHKSKGDDVPAWFLDTDYNDLCFHVSQAFFPRTGAWESLRKALRGEYEESVWDHLAGTVSAPFESGDHAQIAVKVIDDRGNELLVVKSLKEAK
jgi:adenine-specific DNA-methyltransferase